MVEIVGLFRFAQFAKHGPVASDLSGKRRRAHIVRRIRRASQAKRARDRVSPLLTAEAEFGLRLAASRWVAPEFTLAYQLTQGDTWGHHLRLGAGLAVSF